MTWTAPANGGSAITSYTVTPYRRDDCADRQDGDRGTAGHHAERHWIDQRRRIHVRRDRDQWGRDEGPVDRVVSGHPRCSNGSRGADRRRRGPGQRIGDGVMDGAVERWQRDHRLPGHAIHQRRRTNGQDLTGTPPLTTLNVTSLTNGTAYTFTVSAVNAIGTGAASAPSTSVTPRTVPGTPTSVSATAGNASATVTWTAPANGGSVITGYTVTPFIGTTAQSLLAVTVTGAPPATTAAVNGLANGTAYTFRVAATNVAGSGAQSTASAAVTPSGPPNAPTGVTATALSGSATVTWTAPANNGSAITSYRVTPYIGTTAQAHHVCGHGDNRHRRRPDEWNDVHLHGHGRECQGLEYAVCCIRGRHPVCPSFVQQNSNRSTSASTIAVTPTANVTAGNRLVVLVGVRAGATTAAQTVTDSAGNTYPGSRRSGRPTRPR